MDVNTNIQDLKIKVKKFCDDRDWGEPPHPKGLPAGKSVC